MSAEQREEQFNTQRRDQYHHANLAAEQDGSEAAEILRYLSQIDDLPDDAENDEVMGQLISVLTSTANLTAEEVRSNEWYREIILTLYLAMKPTKEGIHGSDREWVHDDPDASLDPLDAQQRVMLEAAVMNSKLALSRSEDFTAAKEATRNVSESVVHDEAGQNGSGGGILGRVGLR